MSNQTKVSNTQKYEDSQGSHIVTPAKVILLHPPYNFKSDTNIHYSDDVICRPILISETEEIEEGEYFVDDTFEKVRKCEKVSDHKEGYTYSVFEEGKSKRWIEGTFYKVLALPEHFSDKHLQAIVDGKMEDGDEVLVKCEYNVQSGTLKEHKEGKAGYEYRKIYLDQQNHITLFPAEQFLEDFIEEYLDEHPIREAFISKNDFVEAMKATAEWAKNNNY